MLSRRIPLPAPPAQQPASALPSYLKRNPAAPTAIPSRPHSPQSRPGSPPPGQRPGSPFRNRPPPPGRPQSPGPLISPNPLTTSQIPIPSLPPIAVPSSDVEVNLVVREIPRDSITIEKPFAISCVVTISASVPRHTKSRQQRVLSLAVQHIQPPRVIASTSVLAQNTEAFSPRVPLSGFSTPSPTSARGAFNYALAHQKLLAASPRQTTADAGEAEGDHAGRHTTADTGVGTLPPPFAEGADELRFSKSTGVVFLGSSAVFLDPVRLSDSLKDHSNPAAHPEDSIPVGGPTEIGHDGGTVRVHVTRDFDLSYLPLRTGFLTVGGLRILLTEDKIVDEDHGLDDDNHVDKNGQMIEARDDRSSAQKQSEVRILKEWDIIGEVWVKTQSINQML